MEKGRKRKVVILVAMHSRVIEYEERRKRNLHLHVDPTHTSSHMLNLVNKTMVKTYTATTPT